MNTSEYEKLMMDLLIYIRTFHQYNLEQKRDLDEIVSIINAIPHNQEFMRNGILFDGSFDNLLACEAILNEKATKFAEYNDGNFSSLNDFLVFVVEDTTELVTLKSKFEVI